MINKLRSIWMVSREFGELAGAGGVKDVVYQLAGSLAKSPGLEVSVVLPCYGFIDPLEIGFTSLLDGQRTNEILELAVSMDEPENSIKERVRFYHRVLDGVHVYLVEADRYRAKGAIYTYTREDEKKTGWQIKGSGHYDFFAMNVLLQKAALELMMALGQRVDIIHCHDGHAALLPMLIREKSSYAAYFRNTACLTTIHNAGRGYHQEIDDLRYARALTGLPRMAIDGALLQGKFDPLLAAGSYSLVNTVSENYARELQESDQDHLSGWLGHELKRRGITLFGITNGIDPEMVSHRLPGGDDGKAAWEIKSAARHKLAEALAAEGQSSGLSQHGELSLDRGTILFSFVGRLTEQKGVSTLFAALPQFLADFPQAGFVMLGDGQESYETMARNLAKSLAGRFCYLEGYQSSVAKIIYRAGDYFVIPSLYEPCGLTDFLAQLGGNIPLVHQVGGLVKVKDSITGLVYQKESPAALSAAMARAMGLDVRQRQKLWQNALASIDSDYSWAKTKEKYLKLYNQCREDQLFLRY